ncbi:MAG: phosphate acyltransferase PlsX [Candidatus Krumholzibacteriia bacterium]
MRIAVDAMGGDRGPEVIAKGAIEAARLDRKNLRIVLVGDRKRVESVLNKTRSRPANIDVVHASEIIGMSEPPANAIRKKKDSSIAVAMRMHKSGEADALVSAGNTGAVVAGSLVTLGRLHGVSRPAITTFYPTTTRRWTVVLDIGANTVCTPKNLLQFGIMGSVFSEYQFGIESPRVGLLNIGEEASKGTDVVRDAYQLLQRGDLNFVGNVEGKDVFANTVDVVVCDGFVGNIVLKFSESVSSFISHVFREELKKRRLSVLAALLLKRAFSAFRSRLDYAEYGGAPLLGINGVVIIGHGSSSVKAIKNAILMAQRYVTYEINDHIEERFRGLVNNLAKVH